jgi:hypothetical protein
MNAMTRVKRGILPRFFLLVRPFSSALSEPYSRKKCKYPSSNRSEVPRLDTLLTLALDTSVQERKQGFPRAKNAMTTEISATIVSRFFLFQPDRRNLTSCRP